MSGAYRVDLEELAEVVARVRRLEAEIADAMDDADRHVARLHASWSGAAAEQQRAAHGRWRRGCGQMHEALAVMRGVADGAHANYTEAVRANVAMFRALG